MKKIVAKFGGSSLTNPESVFKVIKQIEAYQQPLVVVVSAFKGVTDYLLNSLVGTSEKSSYKIIEELERIHTPTIESFYLEPMERQQILLLFRQRLAELKIQLDDFFLDYTPEKEAIIVSYGERLSSLLITMFLNASGVQAKEFLPEKIGLITNGKLKNATVDLFETQKNIYDLVEKETEYVAVFPGFYGTSKDGKITLLGRGGSDYTASCLANCLKADQLDLWKDVDGILTADPNLVSTSLSIKSLTYDEAEQLAFWGAKILHSNVITPLKDQRIELRLFNLFKANGRFLPATIVSHQNNVSYKEQVKSLVFNKDYWLLRVSNVLLEEALVMELIQNQTNNGTILYVENNGVETTIILCEDLGLTIKSHLDRNNLDEYYEYQQIFLIILIGGNSLKNVEYTQFQDLIDLPKLITQFRYDHSICFAFSHDKVVDQLRHMHKYLLESSFVL